PGGGGAGRRDHRGRRSLARSPARDGARARAVDLGGRDAPGHQQPRRAGHRRRRRDAGAAGGAARSRLLPDAVSGGVVMRTGVVARLRWEVMSLIRPRWEYVMLVLAAVG